MEPGFHVSSVELEDYCFGRVAGRARNIEEHLAWCQECADRADALDRFFLLVTLGKVRNSRSEGTKSPAVSGEW